jgi:hypothetical protein
MSPQGLLIVAIVVLLVGIWVMLPLRRREKPSTDDTSEKQLDRLSMFYERILTNIRDLDEDYSTGKMNDADYQTEREDWVQRGVQVLKALDQLGARQPVNGERAGSAEEIDDAIEAAIASYRKKSNP